MNHTRSLPSAMSLALGAFTCASACALPPKSTGELEDDTGDDGSEAADDAVGASSGESGEDGDGPSTGEGSGGETESEQWSKLFPTQGYPWACDVAVDATGRVAASWWVEFDPGAPAGRSGIRVFDPDGTEVAAVEATGEILDTIAFASDGTLRVRGATMLEDEHSIEWTRGYDGELQPTWTVNYEEKIGLGRCRSGSRGIAVDGTDHVATFGFGCNASGGCPGSTIRRHAPDGTLLWERNPAGNPGFFEAPLAVGADGSVFDGAILTWDTYEEVEIRKHAADGTELWMTLVPGNARSIWPTSDGGAYVVSDTVFGETAWEGDVVRLDADGDVVWASATDTRLIALSSDETGFFAAEPYALVRLSSELEPLWSIPLQREAASIVGAAADHQFVFAGNTQGVADSSYWLTLVTLP